MRVSAAAWRPALSGAGLRLWQQQQQPTQQQKEQQQDLRAELRQHGASMAAVLPLAAATIQQGTSTTAEIYFGLAKAIDIYLVVLTVRVLLSWFKQIRWDGEPFNTLRQLTDPYLNLFRGIIPPMGGIDLSGLLGFVLLQFLRNVLVGMISGAVI